MLSKEEIPEQWELQTLSELVDEKAEFIEDGDWIESDDMDESGELGIVQLGQIEKNQLKFEEISRYITREWAEDNNCTVAKPQDLIIPRMSPVLGAAEVPDDSPDFVVPVDAMILRGLKEPFRTFLKYYLNSHFSDSFADKMSTGTTRSRISQSDARKLPIPVPPLEEQEMIVEKLDEIFDSIEEIQEAQDQAEEIKDTLGNSTYKSLFDDLAAQYELKEVKEISDEIKNGGTPKRSKDDYWGGNIPWIKSGELNDGYLSTSEEGLTEEGLNSGSAKLMAPGTVLIAMYGATRGKTAILEKEMTTNQAICGVLVNEERVVPEFLQFCIKAKKRELVGKGRGGGQDNINQTTIKETKIVLPPLETQERICEKISNLEELLENDLDSKRKGITEDLPKSVLAEAFKGNLVDYTPSDDESGNDGSRGMIGSGQQTFA